MTAPPADTFRFLKRGDGSIDGVLLGRNGEPDQVVGKAVAPGAEKILQEKGHYDPQTDTWEGIQPDVAKSLMSGRLGLPDYLAAKWHQGEAGLVESLLGAKIINGEMSAADAIENGDRELLKVQLNEQPAAAWGHGFQGYVADILKNPGEVARQTLGSAVESLPMMLDVGGAAAKTGAVVAGGVGLMALSGPLAPGVAAGLVASGMAVGNTYGTFKRSMDLLGGQYAIEMARKGYAQKDIQKWAPAVGAINGALMTVNFGLLTQSGKAMVLREVLTSDLAKKAINSWVAKYAAGAAGFGAIGATQGEVNRLIGNMAALAENKPQLLTPGKDGLKNFIDAAIKMTLVGAVIHAPGAALDATTSSPEGEPNAALENAGAGASEAGAGNPEGMPPIAAEKTEPPSFDSVARSPEAVKTEEAARAAGDGAALSRAEGDELSHRMLGQAQELAAQLEGARQNEEILKAAKEGKVSNDLFEKYNAGQIPAEELVAGVAKAAEKAAPAEALDAPEMHEGDIMSPEYAERAINYDDARVEPAEGAAVTGKPLFDLSKVEIPAAARAVDDAHLVSKHPAFRKENPFLQAVVNGTHEKLIQGQLAAEEVVKGLQKLAADALKERQQGKGAGAGARLGDWFAPQQKELFDAIENEDFSKLGPAEKRYAEASVAVRRGIREDLQARQILGESNYGDDYITHYGRQWTEILKDAPEKGWVKSIQEFLPRLDRPAGGEGEPQGSFFQQAKFRSDELVPSKNVFASDERYIKAAYRTIAIHEAEQHVATLIDWETLDKSEAGKNAKNFLQEYFNNKKGVNTVLDLQKLGPVPEVVVRAGMSMARMVFIKLNWALQAAKGTLAPTLGVTMGVDSPLPALEAQRLRFTPEGKRLLKNMAAVIPEGPIEGATKPGAGAAEAVRAALQGLWMAGHARAAGDFLLASATKEELAAGKMSVERTREIQLKAARYFGSPDTKSIAEGSTAVRAFTQFKDWAVPMTQSVAELASATVKDLAGKKPLSAEQALEGAKIMSLAALVAAVTGSVKESKSEDSFTGHLAHYARRVLMSPLYSADPRMWVRTAAAQDMIQKTTTILWHLATLERYQEGSKYEGQLKAWRGIQRDLIPSSVKPGQKAGE